MLTALQERVATLLGRLAVGDIALAGGGAVVSGGLVPRTTRDLDYFTSTADWVHEFADEAERALRADGLTVSRPRDVSSFVRLSVSDGMSSCEVDIAEDARILPTVEGPYGPTLAEDELVADKVCALDDRAEARDYVDVWYLARRHDKSRLLELAAMKNPSFSARFFGESLGAIARHERSEFDVDDASLVELRQFYEDWQRELA